jgi:hypothetical protein
MSQGGNAIDLNVVFGDQPTLGREINRLWVQWSSARNSIMDLWSEIERYVHATSTKDTTNETVTDWSNTTHRPKMANLYDTLTINYDMTLFPNDDWLEWVGGDEQAVTEKQRDIVEAYMKTKHSIRASGFRETMRKLEGDWVQKGNAFAQVEYVREYSLGKEGFLEASYVGPKVLRIDPRDIVMNPLADSFQRTPKIIRNLYTIAELHRIVQQYPDMAHFKEILAIATNNRARLRQFNKSDIDRDVMLQFDGFGVASQYFDSGLVEVLDFYGDMWIQETPGNPEGIYKPNHVISVVDRWQVVRDEPVDTWNGHPNIFQVGWRTRTGNLWAQGPLDNLVGLQYRINHLENARADAFDQMIDPDLVFAGDVEEIQQKGGATHYYIAENGTISTLRPDTTVLSADLQIRELTEAMEMYALAPREALGIRSPGEKTAFEVGELNSAAGRSFEHKVNIFQEFLEDIVNAELEVSVRNLDGIDVVQVTDNDFGAVEFKKITKRDISSNGRLVPVGARHFARSAQLTQNLARLQAGPLADPEVAQHVSSLGLAYMYQELLDITGGEELVQPYIRIEERLQAQRLMQSAQDQAQQEAMTNPAEAGGINAGNGGTVPEAGGSQSAPS